MSKLIKDSKIVQAVKSKLITTATTQYNNSDAGAGIDTQAYDEAVVVINAGTFTGDGQAVVSLLECATDAVASATAVSGGVMATITTANDEALHVGSIQTGAYKRYLWVKNVKTGTGDCQLSCDIVLHKADGNPYDNSPAVDLD